MEAANQTKRAVYLDLHGNLNYGPDFARIMARTKKAVGFMYYPGMGENSKQTFYQAYARYILDDGSSYLRPDAKMLIEGLKQLKYTLVVWAKEDVNVVTKILARDRVFVNWIETDKGTFYFENDFSKPSSVPKAERSMSQILADSKFVVEAVSGNETDDLDDVINSKRSDIKLFFGFVEDNEKYRFFEGRHRRANARFDMVLDNSLKTLLTVLQKSK
jgi:hypothetical protein